jgi:basic amino acid/polyamine antiporter, APA family
VEIPKDNRKEMRELRQSISLFQAVMYGTGIILGAGIYVLIGEAAGIAGNTIWISFIIASVIAAFTGVSYAELSSMFPKSAAEFVFVKNAFGNNFIAFIVGCLIVFVAVFSAATVAIGFAGYLSVFFPQIHQIIYAVSLLGVLSFVNFLGIRESVWTNVVFTLIELAGLLVIITAGLVLSPGASFDFLETPATTSEPALLLIVSAAGLIFFAYFGFENIANIAEETKNPSKVIPRALMISILITTIVYILVAISALDLVSWKELSQSDAPLASAAGKAFGTRGTFLLSVIALFATLNTVLMMLVAGSRIIFGIARDGAFPATLAQIHLSRKTPWKAVIIAMIATIVLVVASAADISSIANIAVFLIFIVYGMVNLSLIWLRYRKPNLKRPFMAPATVGKFPVIAGLGLVTSLAMLTQFSGYTIVAGLSVIATSIFLYKIIQKVNTRRVRL